MPAYAGALVVDVDGRIAAMGPPGALDVPDDVPVVEGFVLPGPVDAHVHLAFGAPAAAVAGGLVAVRDLGAPLADALRWRTPPGRPARPGVAVTGPVLTAPRGYPSRGWGAAGFARFIADRSAARAAVDDLARLGVDVVKLALEPTGGQPVPDPEVAREVVAAAHRHGLPVTCHALSARMVHRALDAGVDELAHTPMGPLDAASVQRLVSAGVAVISTLHALVSAGADAVLANAAALVAAGVPMVYGTDLGNAGTRPGVDPRELSLLATAGLGVEGALRAATEGAAGCAGMRGRAGTGRLVVGAPVVAVVLRADPRTDLGALRRPRAVVVGSRGDLTAESDAGDAVGRLRDRRALRRTRRD